MARKPTYEALKQRVKELEEKAEKRKRVEEALLQERDMALKYLDISGVMFIALNVKGEVTFINRKGSEILGYRQEEVIGKNWFDSFLPVHIRNQVRTTFNRLMKGEIEPVEYYENPILTKDGEERNIAWHNTTLKDAEGNTIGTLSSGEDVTERKQSEKALRESEEKYRRIFENSVVGFFQSTPEGSFTNVNPAFARILGYESPEDLLSSITDIATQYYVDTKERLNYQQTLQDHGYVENFEFRVRRKEGSIIWVSTSTRAYFGENGKVVHYEGAVIDITKRMRAEEERKALQDQLMQAQKIESVGRLAGGVAHDFNNMLSVILGHTELVLSSNDLKESIRTDLQEILKAANRSADVTRQLLAFARKQTISPKILDLNEAVERILKMLRRLIGEDIDLAWQPDTDLWPVKMDPVQIDQILANLCVNARDAIEGTGKITLETENVVLDEAYCAKHTECTPGEYVMLAVSDDGYGMDKDTLANVFDPFFTTKEAGEGTGLGLSTIYGIVMQNQGSIAVYSEPGQGTAFKIYLPRKGREAEAGIGEAEYEAPQARGETILIVEDESSVLAVGVRILEKLGYTVLAAEGPGQAMDMARRYSGEIHLVITDMVMPEMNGKKLAEKITTIRPKTKTLFMSGYTATAVAHRGILQKGMSFVHKPFTYDILARKVREALEG